MAAGLSEDVQTVPGSLWLVTTGRELGLALGQNQRLHVGAEELFSGTNTNLGKTGRNQSRHCQQS